MRRRRMLAGAAAIAAPALGVALLAPAAAVSARTMPAGHTLYVSVRGKDSARCGARHMPCRTVNRAVRNASPGDTIAVTPGTYHQQVVVTKPLTVRGFGATIDAYRLLSHVGKNVNAAGLVVLPSGRGSTIDGLRISGAYGEGILVLGASHVLVEHNRVTGNDRGTLAYLECRPAGQVPGDCGEGIHLLSTTRSTVAYNVVTGNSGGVLVTDEFGPASRNLIVGNLIAGNLTDCGVTLPSHNPQALSAKGRLQPARGGVYGNLVEHNLIFSNGTRSPGAGVLIAAAGPGMASYDNTVIANIISGNGNAGVTIHSHTPHQYVSGNLIQGNTIGPNNLLGDSDANHNATTGILVWSAVVPVSVTIRGNRIFGNQTPIWTSPNVTVHH